MQRSCDIHTGRSYQKHINGIMISYYKTWLYIFPVCAIVLIIAWQILQNFESFPQLLENQNVFCVFWAVFVIDIINHYNKIGI